MQRIFPLDTSPLGASVVGRIHGISERAPERPPSYPFPQRQPPRQGASLSPVSAAELMPEEEDDGSVADAAAIGQEFVLVGANAIYARTQTYSRHSSDGL